MFRAAGRRAAVDVELVVVAALGIVVRLSQFFSGRSLWVDEALVANDLAELSAIQSLTQRSPRGQMAPPGFWVVEHLADTISSDEMMLRLFPLLTGIALVVVAAVYATRWIQHRAARLLLVGVIAFSPSLIYYSSEVKQYGVEALLAMIAIMAVAERESLSRVQIVVLAVVMLAFSIPSLLIVPVLGLCWFLAEARRRGVGGAVRYLFAPGAAILVAWGMAAAWTQLAKPGIMQEFWVDAFGPFPSGASQIGWWLRATVGVSHLALSNIGAPLHTENPDWLTTGARVVALSLWGLVLAGSWRVVSALRRRQRLGDAVSVAISNWLAVVPVSLVIGVAFAAASMLELYPFRGRLILVLVPLVAVSAAHGLDVLLRSRAVDRQLPERAMRALAAVAAVVVALAVASSAVRLLLDPYDRWDIEPAIEWIADGALAGDTVFAYCLSDQQLQYYDAHLRDAGIRPERCITSLAVDSVLERAGERRTWFLHGHIRDDLPAVERIVAQPSVVATFRSDGVVALLLDPDSSER